jgi:hypothetical protein
VNTNFHDPPAPFYILDKQEDNSHYGTNNILQPFKNNCNNSAYAQHLINSGHAVGCMEGIIDMVCAAHKGRDFDTTEKYYVY